MIDNSYYSQDVHGPYELHDIGNLELEEGGTIRDCKLAYATFGTLNAAKDNAILIPTWYSGTSKIMEQVYIGKGRALDPGQVFHHRRQSDRQRAFHLAAQHAAAGRDGRIFRVCGSATTCARSTNWSRRNSA